ncbi:hypothetical protein SNOG_02860 [Parastagonospora nodorum SN15]|uniref:Uncharacterized protein n=1 Tax=Phaeosphaeria nodorum (strain SN15 / ATCC MYA-4574 / FGSC 10173) TaxID=321614 RepID=Q0UZF4_PHANO|nr:hypothetical protein SNOG_02860 [Parastagonospora nodorum SN15]EAT89591.2 hypothetical protein SNOG_02860 [Parastagonospora nodorum SN15]
MLAAGCWLLAAGGEAFGRRSLALFGLVWPVWFRFGRGLIARLAGADQHLGQARPPIEQGATIPAANHGRAAIAKHPPNCHSPVTLQTKACGSRDIFLLPCRPAPWLRGQKHALLAVAQPPLLDASFASACAAGPGCPGPRDVAATTTIAMARRCAIDPRTILAIAV